jgi:cyclic pyranopterin phosphate synthase
VFSHLDARGRARMVDVGGKDETERWAVARGSVRMSEGTLAMLRQGGLQKGDVRPVAELAGLMAAKRTADLLPLCHPLPLSHVQVAVEPSDEVPGVVITASVRTTARTGVEMEALTAVAVAALAVYDMIKGVERGAEIREVVLLEKHGGQGGDWTREA